MKALQENTSHNRIRDLLTQLKMNREKDGKHMCYQNSLVGITLKIKNYKTRTYAKNHQEQQRTLENQLRSEIYTRMKCKRKDKCTGLEISKAKMHHVESKGRTERTHLIQNKENTSLEWMKQQKYRTKYKSIATNRALNHQNRSSLKKQSVRLLSSKTQYYPQSKFSVIKPNSMHMRFRTDNQLLRPDLQGWKTECYEADIPTYF